MCPYYFAVILLSIFALVSPSIYCSPIIYKKNDYNTVQTIQKIIKKKHRPTTT